MIVTKGKGYRYIYLIRSGNQNDNKDDGIVHNFISDFIKKNYQWPDIINVPSFHFFCVRLVIYIS